MRTTRVSILLKALQSVSSGLCPLITAKLLPTSASVSGKPATSVFLKILQIHEP